eukprot:10202340-Lingulodinium_polyedra.AAC.1
MSISSMRPELAQRAPQRQGHSTVTHGSDKDQTPALDAAHTGAQSSAKAAAATSAGKDRRT